MQTYIGTILLAGFNYEPAGWAFCDGRLLPISEYEALFNLIGTTYGGDGQTTFALPDLRGRVPVGAGQLTGGQKYTLGQSGGTEQVTLAIQQFPSHSHAMQATANAGNTGIPANALLAGGQNIYTSNPSLTQHLNPNSCTSAGNSQPHENRQPFLTLNWIISLFGVYPSQS